MRGGGSRLRRARVEAVAVCLLHSYADPGHERRDGALLREQLPDVFVVASHEIAAEYREYERASTAAMDAYLGPVAAVTWGAGQAPAGARAARAGPDAIQRRPGGLGEAAAHPARLLLSGPAGGVAAVVPRAAATRSASTWAAPAATSR